MKGDFERLAHALYGGPVKAADFQVVCGTDPHVDRDRQAGALLASMERLGLVRNGLLCSPEIRRRG